MAFLSSPGGLPDFTKAVISLWFRVPQASIDAATAAAAQANALGATGDYSGVNALLEGIVPLVVFGARGKRSTWDVYGGLMTIGEYTSHTMVVPDDYMSGDTTWVDQPADYGWDPGRPSPYTLPIQSSPLPVVTGVVPMNPSMIGINCNNNPPTLYINFETAAIPAMTGYTRATSASGATAYAYFWPYPLIPCPIPQPPNIESVTTVTAVADVSNIEQGMTAAYQGGDGVPVTADAWHHVLVSIDLSTPTNVLGVESATQADSVISAPKMWAAFDDVNYTGRNMSKSNPSGGGPNDVLPNGAFAFIGNSTAGEQIPVPYTYNTSAPVAASGGAIGVPATADLVANIYQVQLAELQIFTGVTLDTGIEKNRRAFISDTGRPVAPLYDRGSGQGEFNPETPDARNSPPFKLLGKWPDISLTRSAKNWLSGFNLGTSKKNFESTGRIRPVRPNPVLGK